MQVIVDDLSSPQVAALLRLHLTEMSANTPAEGNVFALDLASLRIPEITFFTAWENGTLMGCGALKELDPTHGEVKSMRTADQHLGRGIASAILTAIIETARKRRYTRVSLETGSSEPFAAAQRLYRRFGFQPAGAFADYPENRFSRFYTLEIGSVDDVESVT